MPAPALGSVLAALIIVALVGTSTLGAPAPQAPVGSVPDRAADAVYNGMRALGRWQQVQTLGRQEMRETAHFQVWDMARAAGDMSALEVAYRQVTTDLGLGARGKVPLVVHPGEEAMAKYVGDLGERGASGAYWRGVIHLVGGSDTASASLTGSGIAGPLAHELTHYLLDYAAGRRVPVWFSEGVAQWEEYRLTGQKLYPYDPAYSDDAACPYDPSCSEDLGRDGGCINWQVLGRFSTLSDEEAYGASLAAVTLLYDRGGAEGLRQVIAALAAGSSFERAAELVWGETGTGQGRGGSELPGECMKGKVPLERRLP